MSIAESVGSFLKVFTFSKEKKKFVSSQNHSSKTHFFHPHGCSYFVNQTDLFIVKDAKFPDGGHMDNNTREFKINVSDVLSIRQKNLLARQSLLRDSIIINCIG